MNFRICPDCSAHLDFGERCDCQKEKETAPLARKQSLENNYISSLSALSKKVNKGDGFHGN